MDTYDITAKDKGLPAKVGCFKDGKIHTGKVDGFIPLRRVNGEVIADYAFYFDTGCYALSSLSTGTFTSTKHNSENIPCTTRTSSPKSSRSISISTAAAKSHASLPPNAWWQPLYYESRNPRPPPK